MMLINHLPPMPATVEPPFPANAFQAPPQQASAPLGSVPGQLTAGLAEVFGENQGTVPGRAAAFGAVPLRHSPHPTGPVPMAPVDPVFRNSGMAPAPAAPTPAVSAPAVRPSPLEAGQQAWASTMGHTDPVCRAAPVPPPQQMMAQPPMAAKPPTTSMGGVSATALVASLEQKQQGQEPDASSLETLRLQMFGNYYKEIEGRMGELRSVTDGALARSRRALMERMDELGAGLHRDMVALRQEMLKELEDLKRDVFSAVMSISALNDKLGLTDSRFRETWMAVTKALTDRIDNQAAGLATTVKSMESKMDQMVEDRVDAMVEKAMLRQVALWRAKQAAATNAPAQPPQG